MSPIVGILSMGFADQARDFDTIIAGLIDEFESDPVDQWSVDWSEKNVWNGTAPVSAPVGPNSPKPRKRPKKGTSGSKHVDVRGYFVEDNTQARADALAQAMWGLTGANRIDVFVGTSTQALIALRKNLVVETGGTANPNNRTIVMAFTGDSSKVIDTSAPNASVLDRYITGVVDHSYYQLEVQVDILKRLYQAWIGNNPVPKIHVLRNANNPGKQQELDDLRSIMNDPATPSVDNVVEVAVTSATQLTIANLTTLFKDAEMALVLGDPLLFQNASTIRSYFDGRADKIPVMFGAPESADNGALVAVGPSHESLFRRGAYFVRQLLKSLQTVAQLKIEGPKASDIEIVINHQAREAGKWPDFPTKVKTRKRAKHIH